MIPAVVYGFLVQAEALAEEVDAYRYPSRGILKVSRRGISLLEIGELAGALAAGLRNPAKRQFMLATIAKLLVVAALQQPRGRLDADRSPMGPLASMNRGATSKEGLAT